MSPEPGDPTDPREWLRRARSDIAVAKVGRTTSDVLYQDLCFHAQQAAEKALKALLVQREKDFPKTHSIVELIKRVRGDGVNVPSEVNDATGLTRYAVQDRYPGLTEDSTAEDYDKAMGLAERVVAWVEAIIAGQERS